MGSVVRIPGVLHGMARVERCDVLARMTQCKSNRAYSAGFVLNAPEDLPDGECLASFDGYTLQASKDRGLWLTSNNVTRST